MYLPVMFFCLLTRRVCHFQTCMGTERDAATTVDAHKRRTGVIEIDCINRAGLCACSATIAEVYVYHHSPAFSLCVSPCWTGLDTRGRVTGKTSPGLKTGG